MRKILSKDHCPDAWILFSSSGRCMRLCGTDIGFSLVRWDDSEQEADEHAYGHTTYKSEDNPPYDQHHSFRLPTLDAGAVVVAGNQRSAKFTAIAIVVVLEMAHGPYPYAGNSGGG